MVKKLYPLKFQPILKTKIWGGNRLAKEYSKHPGPEEEIDLSHIGESWEIADLGDESNVVSEGFLAENSLFDVLETYLGDLVGDKVFDMYNLQFPVLVKLLDISKDISVQVHPDDEIALERYDNYGKEEFWHILDADDSARIYLGFKRKVTATEFYDKCKDGTVVQLLNEIRPRKGDNFHIKPGTVHSAAGGIRLVEIQQPSDITFRLYDWEREFDPKTAREMHLEEAIDCIDYSASNLSSLVIPTDTTRGPLVESDNFIISAVDLQESRHIYTERYDSFIIYICTQGSASFQIMEGGKKVSYDISKGGTILIPAALDDFFIVPLEKDTLLLEVWLRPAEEVDDYIDENVSADCGDSDSDCDEEDGEHCHCGHNHKS
ncbi:MAG: mannose-6-phosphate isomerase [Bacteroidales bacterium]|jgi:mannose-6-phosphate isomerase|nr:mannose-6-phosphate isomerase [Bacteroidales bacterium]